MEKPSQKHRRQFRDHAKTLQTEEETNELPSADLSKAFHRTYSLHEVLIVLVWQRVEIYCLFPHLLILLEICSYYCIPPSSFSIKKKEKNGEGSWFIPQTKFPLFLFQGYVPKTNTKENQTNKLTKKKNKTEWWKLVTKEHEHFNKVLATKVLNKSFFKIQNQTVLVSCYFPRRRWNEKPSTNTDTQVHCLGSNLLKGSDGFAFVSKAIIFTRKRKTFLKSLPRHFPRHTTRTHATQTKTQQIQTTRIQKLNKFRLRDRKSVV